MGHWVFRVFRWAEYCMLPIKLTYKVLLLGLMNALILQKSEHNRISVYYQCHYLTRYLATHDIVPAQLSGEHSIIYQSFLSRGGRRQLHPSPTAKRFFNLQLGSEMLHES